MDADDQKKWIAITVIGRDRPGIVASLSGILYRNRCNIEELSQTVLRGQFAMILIASVDEGGSLGTLKTDSAELSGELGLDINLRQLNAEDMIPFDSGETEPFILTVRGEDRPGLLYGITEILAERGINITNLAAHVSAARQKAEYMQVLEVEDPQETGPWGDSGEASAERAGHGGLGGPAAPGYFSGH